MDGVVDGVEQLGDLMDAEECINVGTNAMTISPGVSVQPWKGVLRV